MLIIRSAYLVYIWPVESVCLIGRMTGRTRLSLQHVALHESRIWLWNNGGKCRHWGKCSRMRFLVKTQFHLTLFANLLTTIFFGMCQEEWGLASLAGVKFECKLRDITTDAFDSTLTGLQGFIKGFLGTISQNATAMRTHLRSHILETIQRNEGI